MKRWILVLLLFLLTGSIIIWTATQSGDREPQPCVCELKATDIVESSVRESKSSDDMKTRYILHNDGVTEETKNRKPDSSAWYLNRTQYRDLAVTLDVSETYKPTLNFYCETSERGQYWGITSIYNCVLDREYNGIVKQFNGEIDIWLVSPYEIAYIVDGDFYDFGTTQSSLYCYQDEIKAYQK